MGHYCKSDFIVKYVPLPDALLPVLLVPPGGGTTIVSVPEVTTDVVVGIGIVALVTLNPGIVTVVIVEPPLGGSSVQVV
jgi:hypothetical protein